VILDHTAITTGRYLAASDLCKVFEFEPGIPVSLETKIEEQN
jgi:hypothetical protein